MRWFVAALALFAPATAWGADPGPGWIVVVDPSADPAAEARAAEAGGLAVRHVYTEALGGFSFHGDAHAAAALEKSPRVLAVVPDQVFELDDSASWGFFRVDAELAHQAANGSWMGAGVRVLVIDSGVDVDHPDLTPNLDLANSLDCLTPGSTADPIDEHGHGTHVAGIAAAAYNSDGYGAVGVAAMADLVAVRAFGANGYGSTEDILCGIEHATTLARDGIPVVVNMSFSEAGTDSPCDDADVTDVMHEAICDAADVGVIFVAAAGNSAVDAANTIPASFADEVVTVSAIADFDGQAGGAAGCKFSAEFGYECDDTLADFSNGGAVVDVAAPGVGIWSTIPNGHGTKTGTSMAAPYVTGIVAQMLSADPALLQADVEAILLETGECPDGSVNADGSTCAGRGTWREDRDAWPEPLANSLRAVQAVAPPPPAPTITLSATAVRLKGTQRRVSLTWNVTGADAIEVFRNGALRVTTPDDGAWTDSQLGKKTQVWTYQVCSPDVCSNVVQVEI
jgi:subtilisin